MPRLLRLTIQWARLSPLMAGSVSTRRHSSPCGGSTLITSAPWSARYIAAPGTAPCASPRRLLGLDPLNPNEDDLFETVKPLALNAADIDRLVANQGVRALCRYPGRNGQGGLHGGLRLPYRDVVDDLWQATVVTDRLLVRGEIEASNVDRFEVVVRAAVSAGTSTVDLSGVEFFSAAAVRALFGAADLLQQCGRPLVLLDPQVSHVKTLALEFLAEHPAVELVGKKSG